MNFTLFFEKQKYGLVFFTFFFSIILVLSFVFLKSGFLKKATAISQPVKKSSDVKKPPSDTSSVSNPKASGLNDLPSPVGTPETKESFLAREKNLLARLQFAKFDRVIKVSENNKDVREERTTFLVKKDNVRADTSSDAIIVNSEGCFRIAKNPQIIYKYTAGAAEENCKSYTHWNGNSWEQFIADPNFKVLGQQVFQGISVTVVEAQLSIPKFRISFLSKYLISNENGLTIFVSGTSDSKKLTAEFGKFDFTNIEDSNFAIPAGNVTESSELF